MKQYSFFECDKCKKKVPQQFHGAGTFIYWTDEYLANRWEMDGIFLCHDCADKSTVLQQFKTLERKNKVSVCMVVLSSAILLLGAYLLFSWFRH